MVQKTVAKRPRGRPRAYDADTALAQAQAAFWNAGYAATSLDDLSAATGMNRPSLYGAFGDKRAIYLKTLERYGAASRAVLKEVLGLDCPLREALGRVYAGALSIYLSGDSGARGCFLIGTAATEALSNPEVRALLATRIGDLDKALEARIRFARERGELKPEADPAALAKLAAAVLHTLAIRSRAGARRSELEAIAKAGVDLICGSQPSTPSSRVAAHAKR